MFGVEAELGEGLVSRVSGGQDSSGSDPQGSRLVCAVVIMIITASAVSCEGKGCI